MRIHDGWETPPKQQSFINSKIDTQYIRDIGLIDD